MLSVRAKECALISKAGAQRTPSLSTRFIYAAFFARIAWARKDSS